MATVAEMLFQSTSDQTDPMKVIKGPDLAGNFAKGAELAQRKQQLEQKKIDLQQQAEEVEMKKFEKVGGWMDTYSKMAEGPAKKVFGDKFITSGIKALGLEGKIHPLNQEMMIKDSKLAGAITAGIREGKYNISILGDPEAMSVAYPELVKDTAAGDVAALAGEYRETFDKAEAERGQREATKMNAEIAAAGMAQRARDDDDRAPEVDIKKKFNSDYKKFVAEGGDAAAQAKLKKLRASVAYFKAQMDAGKKSTGTLKAAAQSRLGLTGLVDPNLKVAVDGSKAGMQLKGQLDSQFSAAEAREQYGMKAVSEDLPPALNYERALDQLNEAELAYKGAKSGFAKYVKGAASAPKKSFKDLSPTAQKEVIDAAMTRTGKSEEEVRKMLIGVP